MARSRFYRLLLALSAAALVIVAVVLLARDRSDPLVPELIAGDVDEALSQMDTARMPAEAERFLATNRPWRAARVMRGYAERVRELPIEHRVLAARAEAGWDAWPQVLTLLEPVRDLASRDIPAVYLLARARAHRDNTDEAVRIYLALARQYPRTGTGAQGVFLAAGARHDAQDFARARELYQRVVLQYPGTSQMGLAMMRLAGIAFLQENAAEAARMWEQYAARYPRGTHALAATYWAGRARAAMGDSAGAAAHFRSVRQRERDSYYALLASERLGESFWPLPLAAAPAPTPAASRQVASWMQGIDLLRTAGFQYEASAEADRIVAEAGNDRATLYSLAEALAERGYARRAIRLGLRLQGSATPDLRLLRILYPFPYRTLITEEARARGLDPSTVAALIRQESTFEARITSPVGARGLMQIMPATGARLARAVGIDEWDAELLYQPEINVHLGTRYVAQHMENYRGSLPSAFSAYNAGANRVEWWSKWPEYGNDELFTERIPFAETRDYVRILTRNRAIYRGLYGEATAAALR